jgi:hypothetical protein
MNPSVHFIIKVQLKAFTHLWKKLLTPAKYFILNLSAVIFDFPLKEIIWG